jgi:hypothetical protein
MTWKEEHSESTEAEETNISRFLISRSFWSRRRIVEIDLFVTGEKSVISHIFEYNVDEIQPKTSRADPIPYQQAKTAFKNHLSAITQRRKTKKRQRHQ